MKVGDLVKLPKESQYWWSERVGLVIGYGYGDQESDDQDESALHILVDGNKHTRFGANFVELVSESR